MFALREGLVDELLREVHSGEAVHRTFNLSARDLFHVVEGVGEELCPFFESVEYAVLLLGELGDGLGGLPAQARLVNEEFNADLADRVRAQLDRF